MAEGERPTTMQRPYLLRAMHEWMTDNDLTPHIVVDITAEGVVAPTEFAKDGKLVLNISYSATQHLVMSNEFAEFEARFGGVPRRLQIPMSAIAGVYARETGQGMVFAAEHGPQGPDGQGPQTGPDGQPPAAATKRPTTKPDLKVIK
jgi:stringent starvation protein B